MRALGFLGVALLIGACAEAGPAPAPTEDTSFADAVALGVRDSAGASEVDWDEIGRQIDALRENPPQLSPDRRVDGFQIGRCLLEVDGVTRISGPCYYSIEANGDFHIDGPRQVFEGVDYLEGGNEPWSVSTDWWANVFLQDGKWTGYGNEEVAFTNGQGSRWGELEKRGACFSNETLRRDYAVGDFHPDYQQKVRVCLWTV